jgi:hypothetical protein
MNWRLLVYSIPVLLFLSCRKDPELKEKAFPELEAGEMVLVCAEGNFRWGNAEAGLLNLRSGKSEWKAFQRMNGRPPGDVLQSASFWNGKLWLVINNSGRIEGLNPGTFQAEESIGGLRSPRFLQPVSSGKAYASDLYSNSIWILKSGVSVPAGSIPMPGWTEEMLLAGNRVWVLCRNQPYLLGINPETDQAEDTLRLPGTGRSLCAGPSGKIWVSFEGSAGNGPGICLADPRDGETKVHWNDTENKAVPDRLLAMPGGDTLFFLHNGLCRIDESGFFRYPAEPGNWYGLGLDTVRRELWISDVKDYQQESRIIRLGIRGNKIQEYQGGIISSRFYFW